MQHNAPFFFSILDIPQYFVQVDNLSVKWPASGQTEDNTLTYLSSTIRPGQLLAVFGQVGAGKVLMEIGILILLFQYLYL